jgi:hypothetical protein
MTKANIATLFKIICSLPICSYEFTAEAALNSNRLCGYVIDSIATLSSSACHEPQSYSKKYGCCRAVLQAIRLSGSYIRSFVSKSTALLLPKSLVGTWSVMGRSLH